MSLRRLSPAAQLLRTSRLFALPPALPRPATDADSSYNDSDTATLPFPTRAAVETSDASRARGDWGLKRPLPLKSTAKSSNPSIYIENVDSVDQVIDFGSAADHAKTLEKWQEMDLAISSHGHNDREPLRSVFESKVDNTYKPSQSDQRRVWRFKGPSLGGQTPGEFDAYVEKSVKRRRVEFRQFLKNALAESKSNSRRRQLLEEGGDMSELSQPPTVSDEELATFIRHVRKTPEKLDKYTQEFLDLPRDLDAAQSLPSRRTREQTGPPSTHPSAGLSYLRSHSHTFNHPLYGPQENKFPVQARVLAPQVDANGFQRMHAVLGVGGVTTEDTKASFTTSNEETGVRTFDIANRGGGKVWLQLRKASVDPEGRIELGTQRAEGSALYAAGVESQVPGLTEGARRGLRSSSMPTLSSRGSSSGTNSGYGLEGFAEKKATGEEKASADNFLGIFEKSMQR